MQKDKKNLANLLIKADKLSKGKEIALAEEFITITDTIDELSEKLDTFSEELKKKDYVLEFDKEELKGEKGEDGVDGEDYILTESDKEEIASKIEVPVVEKVVEKIIEKTEVIRETPIVTNEVKEVAKYENPESLRDKLESLKEENRLDASAIKNLPEFIQNDNRIGFGSMIKEAPKDNKYYARKNREWVEVASPDLSAYVPTTRTLTINGTTYDLSTDRTWSVGTVTSVAALTLGTTGTDLSSSVATGTTTPVITLNVPTASALNRGALSSTDWSTFNSKESALTFSTGLTRSINTITNNLSTGISGGQSVIGGTASGNNLTLSSTSNATKGKILFGTSAYDEVNNSLGIGTTTPNWKLHVAGTVGADNIIAQFGDANKGVNIKTLANGTGLITSWSYEPTDPSAIAISAGANFGFNAAPNNFYGMGLGAARNGKYDMWFQTGTANGGGYRWYTGGTNERMTINKDGKVGIGTTTPTALLMLAAGTATANTAPLKFTTGTNLTTAEAGAMEYNNTFHVTNSDATRRHVVTAPNTTKVTAAAPYTNDGYIIVNIGGIDFKLMTTA